MFCTMQLIILYSNFSIEERKKSDWAELYPTKFYNLKVNLEGDFRLATFSLIFCEPREKIKEVVAEST